MLVWQSFFHRAEPECQKKKTQKKANERMFRRIKIREPKGCVRVDSNEGQKNKKLRAMPCYDAKNLNVDNWKIICCVLASITSFCRLSGKEEKVAAASSLPPSQPPPMRSTARRLDACRAPGIAGAPSSRGMVV